MVLKTPSEPSLLLSSPTTTTSTNADPKLVLHVTQVVAELRRRHQSYDPASVADALQTKHRAYKRRDPAELRAVVRDCLHDATAKKVVVGKRKRQELEEEERYEREAQEEEAARAATTTPSPMSLNAGLRRQYTELSEQERLARAAAAQAAAAAASQEAAAAKEEDTATTTPLQKMKKKKRHKQRRTSTDKKNDDDKDTFDDATSSSSSLRLTSSAPVERYADLGGMDRILTQIQELIEYPLRHPELFAHLGVDPPRGVLLRGPPGCGKTHLANAVAGELGVSFFAIAAPEIIGGVSGESESRVRDLFKTAADASPALIFIDEIDAVAPKRGDGGKGSGGGNSMEKRIVAQLLTCMDSLANVNVMVIGATNRPDAIDPALRRAGRFDREIRLGVPDERAREGILRKMTVKMRLHDEEEEGGEGFDFKLIAKKTPGFVGADLRSLAKEAAVIAINRIFKSVLVPVSPEEKEEDSDSTDKDKTISCSDNDVTMEAVDKNTGKTLPPPPPSSQLHATLTPAQLSPLYITMADFLAAVPSVQPSSKREGFATVPDVSWEHVGALNAVRDELTLSVLEPIHHPERFRQLGLPLPAGVLLYGPPGCGKTLLAKAISHESGANFISVKGPELLDKYVGESERAVRQVFERARSSSPCVVFFDELDSLCPKRGGEGSGGGGGVSERVVNQLLTEMDGLESRSSVFVIAATNRPELIDPAMLRPGRLDKLLYVPLPTPEDRIPIITALAKKVALGPDVDLVAIATSPRANGFSGADCAALLREAGLAVLRDCGAVTTTTKKAAPLQITAHHFEYAFDHVRPSVSKKDQAKYDRMRDRMARARTRGGVEEGNNKTAADGSNKVVIEPTDTTIITTKGEAAKEEKDVPT